MAQIFPVETKQKVYDTAKKYYSIMKYIEENCYSPSELAGIYDCSTTHIFDAASDKFQRSNILDESDVELIKREHKRYSEAKQRARLFSRAKASQQNNVSDSYAKNIYWEVKQRHFGDD